MMLFF